MLVARQRSPDILRRGVANAVSLALYGDAGDVTVSSGTFQLLNAAGTEVVAASAVTASTNTASYSIGSGVLSAYDLGEGWEERWALTLGDGSTPVIRRPAIVGLFQLFPTVSPLDLSALHSELPGLGNFVVDEVETTWEEYAWMKLDASWHQIIRWLVHGGQLPDRITSGLFDLHQAKALHIIYEDLLGRKGDRYADKAAKYALEVERLKSTLTLRYDLDGDGHAELTIRGLGGQPEEAAMGWPWGYRVGMAGAA
jgi:hypothetical protein